MRDVSTIVKDYYDTAAVPVTAAEAMAHTTVGNDRTPVPNWVVAVAAAAVVIVLIGGLSVFLGGSEPSVVPAGPSPETTEPAEPSEVLVPVEGWSPLLSETVAGVPPPAATCTPGATPDLPGPIGQVRPGEGPWSNQPAVFDTRAGRIVFVDETAETWTFDVCTNTWQRMEPEDDPYSAPELGVLVYDVDSDRTIAFSPAGVSVYNANMNSWTHRAGPQDLSFGSFWLGSVYDPASGLVLALADDGVLAAYDVDTDTWTEIGPIIEPGEITSEGQTQTVVPGFLVGHIAETDRLAFLGFDGAPFQDEGGLLNPRTGDTVPLSQPVGGVQGGFGSFYYATGGETAYVYGRGVCRLDPVHLNWDCNDASRQTEGSSAMVYDPVNDRIVVINNSCCTWPGTTVTDGVHAIDFNTGDRIELLTTANTRTETGGS